MAEASEMFNRSNTICHYKRFSGFSESNCNGCNVEDSKMVELLHLLAENRLSTLRKAAVVVGRELRLELV
jgi:hypothetical protein